LTCFELLQLRNSGWSILSLSFVYKAALELLVLQQVLFSGAEIYEVGLVSVLVVIVRLQTVPPLI